MEKTKRVRNLNIEILRIFAMVLIVACHGMLHITWLLNADHESIYKPGWKSSLTYLIVQYGQVGVSIFFIISGFFLVNKTFNWTRIFKTWFQMFCYGALVLAAITIASSLTILPSDIAELFHGDDLIRTAFAIITPFFYGTYWFITAYICMLLLLPFLNTLFDNLSEHYIGAFIAILAMFGIWGIFFGRVGGWNDVTYAILGYMVGGWIRKYGDQHTRLLKTGYLWLAIIGSTLFLVLFNHVLMSDSGLVMLLGWRGQARPGVQSIPMIIGAAIFILVNRVNMTSVPQGIQTFTLKLAASTFGVYLLHENMFLYRLIWPAVTRIVPVPNSMWSKGLLLVACVLIVYVTTSLIAFLIDTLIMHPLERRILVFAH
ncbi:peptidoglycan/LPS O-acetylase OafA/YrhL [Bifidobacterium commune]|uniref:Acyltransferase family protein n=1 Tax=Bifidobacterium commune TaxID=1505727 RepID=A0A1C4H754_9BIFI|nr:acyltransferase [Bifidobacterium commune]MBB2955433.1 peptidoglycan/LPS O-acetylase OafA/YrhL [Bifidobacterium commune]SCC80561.1 Acyltransferase family protein [Bifidobacterium commune]